VSTFESSRWYSERVRCEVTLNRWGHAGQPVLVFPTAAGDAGEIDRFLMIRVLEPLLAAGRVKIYSCDSVAGQAWFGKEGSPEHRMWMTHQFHQYIKNEVVPAIRMDCKSKAAPSPSVMVLVVRCRLREWLLHVCTFVPVATPDICSSSPGPQGVSLGVAARTRLR